MKNNIIIAILTSISLNSYSQEIRIFTDVLQYLNSSHPMASIGVEVKKNSNSLALNNGYFYNNFMFNENCNGYFIDLKYKLHRVSR